MGYRMTSHVPSTPKGKFIERRKAVRRRRVARRTMVILPTTFTLGNVLCGFFAIFFASRKFGPGGETIALPFDWSPLTLAALFIFLGMAFDALDGQIARLTRSTSLLGEQLDSMADMVTFGIAPAFIAVMLVGVSTPFVAMDARFDSYFDRIALVTAGIYVCCAALRLARFNVEQRDQHTQVGHAYFKGMPSPGAAGTVASLVLLHQHFLKTYVVPGHFSLQIASVLMVGAMVLVSFAMVSRLRYVHIINRYLRGRVRFSTIVRAMILVLVAMINVMIALSAAFLLYALSAPILTLWDHFFRRSTPTPPA